MRSATRVHLCLIVLISLSMCGVAREAQAHGQPVQLAFWGGYPPGVSRCQRTISRAAARCIGDVIAARQACLTPVLSGGSCDVQALNATVATLRQQALTMVGPDCTSTELQLLLYLDLSDAYRDIVNVCRRLDTAAISASYLPALADGAVTPMNEPTRSCVEEAIGATSKLLEFAIRVQQRALDRIAATQLSPAAKQQLVTRATTQTQRVRDMLRARIVQTCSEEDFTAAYGRDIGTFLDGVATQARCHGQYVYVQDAVLCPVIACGNGIQEPDEQCDDGNTVGGDGCSATCARTDQ